VIKALYEGEEEEEEKEQPKEKKEQKGGLIYRVKIN